MDSKICFIGSGNMGFALMSAASRVIKAENIFITDADSEKAHNASVSLGVNELNSNTEAAEKCNYIFLAVKPQALEQVLVEIAPVLYKKFVRDTYPVLVSMAAGWSIDRIQSVITGALQKNGSIPCETSEKSPIVKVPVVRMMPNTPALIGKGMIALCASKEATKKTIDELEEILTGAGIVDVIDEHLMNAVTGLSGSGPAYVFLFIEALADGAVRAGLPRDKAVLYAAQTVIGAASMVQETGRHPGELKDMVTSPGGTTIAGIAALEDGSFRSTVMKAVEAAWKRAKELG